MNYFPLQIELDYSYSVGSLKPYFDALTDGRALASRCSECGFVSFPPRLVCHLDHQETDWIQLNGIGQVTQITQSTVSENDLVYFALIKMEGAMNLTLGRLFCDEIQKGARVQLIATDSEVQHPAQSAYFMRADETSAVESE